MGDDTQVDGHGPQPALGGLQGRSFSLAEAIGRLGGPGVMKGASPVAPARQSEAAIDHHLRSSLEDVSGMLRRVLLRQIVTDEALAAPSADPLAVLAVHVRRVLSSDHLLADLVREADVEWGRTMNERPHFEREEAPPHPDDPYTLASVRVVLERLLARTT